MFGHTAELWLWYPKERIGTPEDIWFHYLLDENSPCVICVTMKLEHAEHVTGRQLLELQAELDHRGSVEN